MFDFIQLPILFNPLKHHIDFIKESIKKYSDSNNNSLIFEKPEIKIGENNIDIYTGELSVNSIVKEVLQLLSNYVCDKYLFFEHIDQLKERYFTIELSDQSKWVILKGEFKERFIHIHPAKKTKHSIRVKANTLKTVFYFIVFQNRYNHNGPITQNINSIRQQYLNLSPIKSFSSANSIMKLYDLLKV